MSFQRAFLAILMLVGLGLILSAQEHADHEQKRKASTKPQSVDRRRAPEELLRIPSPKADAAAVPIGFRAEVVLHSLTYPTSVEFDVAGRMYVAEGGYIYGDEVAVARVLRVADDGRPETIAEQLNGPITDLLWHDERLYISHRGKISVWEGGRVRDIVSGLPSGGDHHNNQMVIGPDGKLYFGQGVATNSGVVGLDNFKMGWLSKYPELRDVPAKDIRLTDQGFSTADPLSLFSAQGQQKRRPPAEQNDENSEANAGPPESGQHTGHSPATQTPSPKGSTQQHPTDTNSSGAAHADHGPAAPVDKDRFNRTTKPDAADSDQEHDGHAAKEKQSKSDHQSHADVRTTTGGDKQAVSGKEHEGHLDATDDAAQPSQLVKTYAFQPFGKTPPDDGAVRGATKANGTILRMNLDGSDLEVYAWGLRNPFGLGWSVDEKLYASDNGYDERGSRPIAHAPDSVWQIKQDAWYGFPDYAGGTPVTDARFRPERGAAPKFLMRDHPQVERPLLNLPNHVGAAKLAFSHSPEFGFVGEMFLALSGDMNPITGDHDERSGFEVVRISLNSGEPETFFKARQSALGPQGAEYVATAGPRRPVDVVFSKDGKNLYVVDVGAMAIISTAAGPMPRPYPGTGVVWRVTRAPSASLSQPRTSGTPRAGAKRQVELQVPQVESSGSYSVWHRAKRNQTERPQQHP